MSGFAGNGFFSFGLLHLYIAVFGKLFDGLEIRRKDAAGNVIQQIPVPINYGPKSKWYRRITEDPNLTQQIAYQLPRMGFELNSITYVSGHQTSPIQRATNVASKQDLFSQFKHTTYNMDFSLTVIAKNESDNFQIIEQILPFFTPDWVIKINPIPQMNYTDECVLTFNNAVYEKEFEGDLDSERRVSWTLNFTMQARIYGPVYHTGLIKRVMVDFLIPPGADPITVEDIADTPRSARITITPGLTANGQPTSNAALTIPYQQIHIDDPWAYITKLMEFDDNKKFNPVTLTDVPAPSRPV